MRRGTAIAFGLVLVAIESAAFALTGGDAVVRKPLRPAGLVQPIETITPRPSATPTAANSSAAREVRGAQRAQRAEIPPVQQQGRGSAQEPVAPTPNTERRKIEEEDGEAVMVSSGEVEEGEDHRGTDFTGTTTPPP